MNDLLATVNARFRAEPEGLLELHAAFDRFFAEADGAGAAVSAHDRMAMLTAAAEIAANIVDHACHGLPDAEVRLVLARRTDSIEASFEDPGVACGEATPDAQNPIPHMGLGLAVARASVDALEYARDGGTNHWRLVRKVTQIG
jgi:serine/threonine-protein kinase RsbW